MIKTNLLDYLCKKRDDITRNWYRYEGDIYEDLPRVNRQIKELENMGEAERKEYEINFLKKELEERLRKVGETLYDVKHALTDLFGSAPPICADSILIRWFSEHKSEKAHELKADPDLVAALDIKEDLEKRDCDVYIYDIDDGKFFITYD